MAATADRPYVRLSAMGVANGSAVGGRNVRSVVSRCGVGFRRGVMLQLKGGAAAKGWCCGSVLRLAFVKSFLGVVSLLHDCYSCVFAVWMVSV